ncbi:hypothetical protein D3C73_1474530 [compost metagenome]
MHTANGVTHRMHILTADIWFGRVIVQEFLDVSRFCIHPGFHVTCVIETAVVEHTFVMNHTCWICRFEVL